MRGDPKTGEGINVNSLPFHGSCFTAERYATHCNIDQYLIVYPYIKSKETNMVIGFNSYQPDEAANVFVDPGQVLRAFS